MNAETPEYACTLDGGKFMPMIPFEHLHSLDLTVINILEALIIYLPNRYTTRDLLTDGRGLREDVNLLMGLGLVRLSDRVHPNAKPAMRRYRRYKRYIVPTQMGVVLLQKDRPDLFSKPKWTGKLKQAAP